MSTTLSPLLLASDFLFVQADNSYASADPQKLLNPNRTAMLVDEIRFSKNIFQTDAETTYQDFTELLVDIKFGGIKLTNNYVPLRSFAPTYFAYPVDNTLTWHLPRPLYVPPDVQFNVSLKRSVPPGGAFAAPGVNSPVIVALAGRSIPGGQPVPKSIYVPFACATTAYGGTSFVSSDADIGNPFDTPMRTVYFNGFNQGFPSPSISPQRQPILVQATMSNGKMFIRDQTPILALFPPNRPVLRSRGLLQPKEFIRFQLDIQQPNIHDDTANLCFTTIGMTGYRELQTPQGSLP